MLHSSSSCSRSEPLCIWFLSSCEHASLPLHFVPVNLYGLAMNASLLWALSFRCIQSHSTWHSTKIFLPQDAWLQSQVYAFLLSCLVVLVLQSLVLRIFASICLSLSLRWLPPLYSGLSTRLSWLSLTVVRLQQCKYICWYIWTGWSAGQISCERRNLTKVQKCYSLSCMCHLLLPDLELHW